jgi:hypothetical protein
LKVALMKCVEFWCLAPLVLVADLALWMPEARAEQSSINPVTGYNIKLMPSPDNGFLGWVELVNATEPPGYVYIQDKFETPHLNFNKSYIVMSVRPGKPDAVLSILRNERRIQISFFNCECAGSIPSASIETGASKAPWQPALLSLPSVEADSITSKVRIGN